MLQVYQPVGLSKNLKKNEKTVSEKPVSEKPTNFQYRVPRTLPQFEQQSIINNEMVNAQEERKEPINREFQMQRDWRSESNIGPRLRPKLLQLRNKWKLAKAN